MGKRESLTTPKVLKRYSELKRFYLEFRTQWQSTHTLINIFGYKKHNLYSLNKEKLLERSLWDYEFDIQYSLGASYSDKLSNYWRITMEGILYLHTIFNISIHEYAEELLISGKFN